MTSIVGVCIFGIIWVLSGLAIRLKPQLMSGYDKTNPPTRDALNRVAVAFAISGLGMIVLFCCSFFIFSSNLLMALSFFVPLYISLLYTIKVLKPKMKKTIIAILISSFLVVVALGISSMQETSVGVDADSLKISGIYGETIPLNDLEGVRLLDSLPEIGMKMNGFGFGTVRKGYFSVDGVGRAKLFLISDKGPFIRVDAKGKCFFLNLSDSERTVALYNTLLSAVGQ